MGIQLDHPIDWDCPWLQPYRALGAPLLRAEDMRGSLNAHAEALGLCNHRGFPLRFVPQAELPRGVAYETYISQTGCVPTRDNLHDFFNALVWLTFPRIKRRLNEIQAHEIALTISRSGARGPVRDVATLLDENGAFFIALDPAMITSLRQRRWHALFVDGRAAFESRQCRVVLFGHALMEKLVQPYKAITAHAWPLAASVLDSCAETVPSDASWDGKLAERVDACVRARTLHPLPVLGVPGWTTGQDAEFYSDAGVFRPAAQAPGRR